MTHQSKIMKIELNRNGTEIHELLQRNRNVAEISAPCLALLTVIDSSEILINFLSPKPQTTKIVI